MAKKRQSKKGVVPPPKCKAILLCDQTIIETGTGKVSIIGSFGAFVVPQIPGILRQFTVYMHLTDGIAGHEYEFTVELHDLSDDKIIARGPAAKIPWGDKLSRMNFFIPVPAIPVAHTGAYDLVVLANGQEIDRQKFMVMTPPTPRSPEKEHEDE